MINRLAKRLARTKYGQRVMAEEADLNALHRRPSPRLYLGLALIALSYLIGWAALLLAGCMALEGGPALTLAASAVAAFVLVHLLFAAGVWLAGANYAAILLHWLARRLLLARAGRDS